ncbi:MAG: outer membrane beta-barrel protein [Chromatiales bacterium]|nr:outer membrane beta-barrel protein [Chromatiales bacterium]
MNAPDLRSVRVAAVAVAASALLPLAAAAEGGPRYTYLGASYEWTDVKYAVRAPGSSHDGINIEGSVSLSSWLHLFGGYYDGDFGLQLDEEFAAELGLPPAKVDFDFSGYHVGLGVSYPLTSMIDIVGRAAYVSAELDTPLGRIDDDGFMVEGLVRAMISDNIEVQVGYSYTDLRDADIQNRDLSLGLVYNVTNEVAVRLRGVVFDNDTSLELGIRLYFGDGLTQLF